MSNVRIMWLNQQERLIGNSAGNGTSPCSMWYQNLGFLPPEHWKSPVDGHIPSKRQDLLRNREA